MTTEQLTEKVVSMDERLTKLESTRPYLEDLLKQSIQVNSDLSTTMQSVQLTMSKMDTKLSSLETKVDTLDGKVNDMQEDQSFNIMKFMKKYFPWIVVAVGAVVYGVSKFVSF